MLAFASGLGAFLPSIQRHTVGCGTPRRLAASDWLMPFFLRNASNVLLVFMAYAKYSKCNSSSQWLYRILFFVKLSA